MFLCPHEDKRWLLESGTTINRGNENSCWIFPVFIFYIHFLFSLSYAVTIEIRKLLVSCRPGFRMMSQEGKVKSGEEKDKKKISAGCPKT